MEVARQALKLARDLVTLNSARVRAGVAAPVEVTQAEAQAAAGVQNVILGEKAVQDAGDTLKVIMNLPISGSWSQQIQPTTVPTSAPISINLDETIQKALRIHALEALSANQFLAAIGIQTIRVERHTDRAVRSTGGAR